MFPPRIGLSKVAFVRCTHTAISNQILRAYTVDISHHFGGLCASRAQLTPLVRITPNDFCRAKSESQTGQRACFKRRSADGVEGHDASRLHLRLQPFTRPATPGMSVARACLTRRIHIKTSPDLRKSRDLIRELPTKTTFSCLSWQSAFTFLSHHQSSLAARSRISDSLCITICLDVVLSFPPSKSVFEGAHRCAILVSIDR